MDNQISQREKKKAKDKDRRGRGHTSGGARRKLQTAENGKKNNKTQKCEPCSSIQ